MITRRYEKLQKTHEQVQVEQEAEQVPKIPESVARSSAWLGQGDMVTENMAANARNERLQAEAAQKAANLQRAQELLRERQEQEKNQERGGDRDR